MSEDVLARGAWTDERARKLLRRLFDAAVASADPGLAVLRNLPDKPKGRCIVVGAGKASAAMAAAVDAAWPDVKLSGIVVSRNRWLRVRNSIYEHVFDGRWAREHARLNVNWRRRLSRLAAVLLVIVALVTVPFAIYAWQQKIEADFQARMAQLERDEATRQRIIAEKSLAAAKVSIQTANAAVGELKRYDPASAEAIAEEAAKAEQDLQKNLNELTAKLRAERDELARKLDAANQRLAARDSPSSGPGRAANPPPASRPRAPDEDLIRRTLVNLEIAYGTKNVDTVRRLRPMTSQESKALLSDFADALDYRVTFDRVDIQFSSERQATVTAARDLTKVSAKSGQKTTISTSTALVTFIMEKRGDNWTIVRTR